ncbi:MAG: hypothetical protein ACYTGA_00950 [Planctomycetota bacterium]|jgi:hypothetical protein
MNLLGYIIGIIICFSIACFTIYEIANPKARLKAHWSSRFGVRACHMSVFGIITWLIASSCWGIVLLAFAIEYQPIKSKAGWVLGVATGLFFGRYL